MTDRDAYLIALDKVREAESDLAHAELALHRAEQQVRACREAVERFGQPTGARL